MKAGQFLRLLLLLVVCFASCPFALADGTPADLGPAAENGIDASNTIAKRAAALHFAMACSNEFAFAQGFSFASRYGKAGYAPNPGLAQWPVTQMLGKAELLLDQRRERPPCQSILTGDIVGQWNGLTSSNSGSTKPEDVVNYVYRVLFDPRESVGEPACSDVAQAGDQPGTVRLTLSQACLARQIRVVMTDPRHGPWTNEGGVVTPELPGTSAEKLPCLSEFKFNVKGLNGDWDMAVIEYTRLTSLLYRYRQANTASSLDIQLAIDALNRRFLTLRSSPEQGATAREQFNFVTSCGNLENQFGDAEDTVNGTGVDPGANDYSQAAKDALGDDDSFWDKLLKFLAALVTVVVAAVGAAIVGVVAGIIAGALAGAVAVAVAVAVGVGLVVFITLVGGGIQETENHLLMQNTSRYLKNKLMMAELSRQGDRQGFNTITDLNEDVRTWLLEHMQRIASEDFVEYNAKPYNRLSHASILNLLDYACDVSWNYDASPYILSTDNGCHDKDRAIVTAAAAVLDLSAAKDAVGSFEGRRLIPYRRLAEQNYEYYNGRSLLELVTGADNQLAALQIWTGQMRHAPARGAGFGTFGDLEWYSTSQYRPDPMILDIAVNKSVPREQQYRHHTRERYASGNGWLITAGGTDEGPAQGFHSPFGFTIYPPINGDVKNDRGVGVPTTLMTSALVLGANGQPEGRARIQQFLRFEGNKKDWGKLDDTKPLWSYSDNNCVAGSFACGRNLAYPSDFNPAACKSVNLTSNFFVVDSTKCPSFNDNDGKATNDILIAIFQSPKGWGFFEVAQANAYGHSASVFADALRAQNQGRFATWDKASSGDKIEYFAVTQNRLLKFTPDDEDFGADRRACGVVNHESGARLTISNVPAAQQGSCLSVGPRIFIDLNDAKNPIRRGEGGLKLESFGR